MEMVPIKELLDLIDKRLDRIEGKLDAQASHTHHDRVSWTHFVTVLVSLTGLIVLVAINI